MATQLQEPRKQSSKTSSRAVREPPVRRRACRSAHGRRRSPPPRSRRSGCRCRRAAGAPCAYAQSPPSPPCPFSRCRRAKLPLPPRSQCRPDRHPCPVRRPGAESPAACARRSCRPPRALFSFAQPWFALLSLALLFSGDGFARQNGVFDLSERRPPHNLFKRPPLQLAQRARLADAHHIAQPRRTLLVMGIELLGRAHDPFVFRMGLAHLYRDHNGLLHLGRNYMTNLLIAPRARRRRRLYFFLSRRHLRAPFAFFVSVAVVVFFAFFSAAGADFCVLRVLVSAAGT